MGHEFFLKKRNPTLSTQKNATDRCRPMGKALVEFLGQPDVIFHTKAEFLVDFLELFGQILTNGLAVYPKKYHSIPEYFQFSLAND